jgi:HAE1 family hydrophobic/amphiphilic exporter-1
MAWLERNYGRFMRLLLRWRFVTLIIMVGLGYSTYLLFASIDREFFGGGAEREIRIDVLMERSFSVEQMQALFEQIETMLLERKDELELTAVSSRFQSRTTRRGQYQGDLNLFLTEEGDMTPTMDLRRKIEAMLPDVPGVEYKPGRMRHWGGSESGVTVELKGEDQVLLGMYAAEVKELMETVPAVENVQTTLESGDDEIHLSVDRDKLEKFQISSLSVARTVSSALSTRATTRVKGYSGEIDVILQLKGTNRVSLAELLNINLENRAGDLIPLHSVVSFDYRKGPIAIRREDRKAIVSVVGDTEQGSSFFAKEEVRGRMSQLDLPPGYSWEMGRDWRRARQGEEESTFAIVLALILMYIIMASLFESFLHPFTILFTVPFSLIGVAWIFNFTNTALSQSAYLGILVLFGIVVNNGIILVDHINFLRRSGLSRNEAIIQGGRDRHRPIIMTACTSIFGLMPLTLPFIFPQLFPDMGGGSSYWAPVSLAVLGGLTTSTFLTLVILPSLYSYMDDLSRGLKWIGLRLIRPSLLFRAGESQ